MIFIRTGNLHACLMEHDMGIRIRQLLTEQNRAFFTNVIVDDVWVIYYNDLVDEDQKGYLKKLPDFAVPQLYETCTAR